MEIYTNAPLEDPRSARTVYKELEAIGYDGGFSFEAKHDPFLPLAIAAEHTTTLRLGTGVAIAFARNPMNLANLGYDMQVISNGRFILGLGSQIKPHIEKRFSSTWSHPAARMREIVQAIKSIWACWEGQAPLNFQGEFYQHSLMIPTFDPGPNPFGPPPIYTGGFGPLMTAVAGEVADGFITHSFHTRETLRDLTLPALEKGLAKAGRSRQDLHVMAITMVVTASTEEEFAAVQRMARKQVAFYGSTPAYRSTLDHLGLGELHLELNRLSKEFANEDRWDQMANLIDDKLLNAICVVGERHEIAAKLRARLDGIADSVNLTLNRRPDPGHWGDVVRDFKRLG